MPQTPNSVEALAERYGPAYKWLATLSVMLGCVATVLSATIVNVAMPDIMGEFGMGQDKVQWLSTAFLASMTVTMLATAWTLATFGPRKTYVTSLAVFAAASILGAASPGEETLILARTLQGACAGLVQPLAMVVIFSVFDPSKRGLAMGIFGLGVVLAPALGPTVGGMLIDNYSWRYVFLLAPPLCAGSAVLSLVYLPEQSGRSADPFDWWGFLWLCATVASFLTALSSGQREGWDSNFVRTAFFLSGAGMALFIRRQLRSAHPLLTLELYLNPRFVASSAVAFILGMGLFGSTYLIPLFVQTVQGYMPTESGLLLMPGGIALGLVSPLAGRLADHIAPRWLIALGLALFGWSSLLMAHADTSTEFWSFAGWVVLGRLGLGFILPSLNSGALRVLRPDQVSQGAGAVNFMRQLGGAVGVSILSVYLERQTTLYAAEFNALQNGRHATYDALDLISMLLGRAGVFDDVAQALRPPEVYRYFSQMVSAQASMMGFRESFFLVALIAFAALVPAWFMRPSRRQGASAARTFIRNGSSS
ncbi:MDR family MFS transporter [Fundidesulfovibrio butyratiphilus]